jgi:hypothetical protein
MGNVLWQQPWPAAPLMRMRDPPPPPPPPSSSGSCSMRPPCPHSHVLPLSYSSSPTSTTHHSHPYAASLPPSLREAAMPPSHCSFPPCAAIVPARPAPMQVVSAPSVPPTRASQAKATCLAHRSRSPSLRGPIMDHAVLYIERKSFSFPLLFLHCCSWHRCRWAHGPRVPFTAASTYVCIPYPLYWSLRVLMPILGAALCPSKSGLMNKHIVKHIVPCLSGLMIHFWVPCARQSPD